MVDILSLEQFDPAFEYAYFVNTGAYCSVNMSFTIKPYGRGPEVDLGDNTETTLPWLIFTEATVAGDVPALGRLVVDNDDGTDVMRWIVWGVQSRRYSAAATAALFYEAESCSMVAPTAAAAGPAGASGGGSNVARNTNLGTTATNLIRLGTSSTAQTHAGAFRVFARVYAPNTNAGTVSVGISWSPAQQGGSVINATVPLESGGAALEATWVMVDLGLVSIPVARKGSQGWLGTMFAQSTASGDDIDVDWIALVPVDESSGETYARVGSSPGLIAASGGDSVEIRHDAVLGEDGAGTYWYRPDVFEGDHLFIPPSGAEARTLRVIVRFSRHIPLSAARPSPTVIPGADIVSDLSARLFVTPRYLVVPSP